MEAIHSPGTAGNELEDLTLQLTQQQLHLWEHAALLYHAFRWQEAADTFASLAQQIHNPELQLYCLLNCSLIMARFGDYERAMTILNVAAKINSDSLILVFIMGSIAYEQQDYSKAEFCFQICLGSMNHEAIDFSDAGLDIILTYDMVLHNRREARAVQSCGASSAQAVYTIPADVIFEAPRCESADHEADSLYCQPKPTSTHIKPVPPVHDHEVPQNRERVHDDHLAAARLLIPRKQVLKELANRPKARHGFDSHDDTPPHPTVTTSATSVRSDECNQSWHGRRKSPYVPRDARAQSDSSRELACLVKKGTNDKRMTPKDPRGEYESVRELSSFVKNYAPDIVLQKAPELFDLAPEVIASARLAYLLDEHYGESVTRPLQDRTLPSASPIWSDDDQYFGATTDDVKGLRLSSKAHRIDVLQPVAHRPTSMTACIDEGGCQHDSRSDGSSASRLNSSSGYDREWHRALALQTLEGKPAPNLNLDRTLPLYDQGHPYDPGGQNSDSLRSSLPSTIGTKSITEKIRGWW